jgi:hypothetical protein
MDRHTFQKERISKTSISKKSNARNVALERPAANLERPAANKAANKKEQGAKPCSKNCVDPISPQSWI